MNASANQILYPLFAMTLLVAIVVTLLWSLRDRAIRERLVSIKYYRDYTGASEPDYNKVVSRHYNNLFEMPVLFYLVVVLAYVTHHVTIWMTGGAWVYVLCRYVHSYIHLTSNNVIARFLVFAASMLVLLAMWIGLFVMLLRAS